MRTRSVDLKKTHVTLYINQLNIVLRHRLSSSSAACTIKYIIQSTKLCKKMLLCPKSEGELYSIRLTILKEHIYLKSFLIIHSFLNFSIKIEGKFSICSAEVWFLKGKIIRALAKWNYYIHEVLLFSHTCFLKVSSIVIIHQQGSYKADYLVLS